MHQGMLLWLMSATMWILTIIAAVCSAPGRLFACALGCALVTYLAALQAAVVGARLEHSHERQDVAFAARLERGYVAMARAFNQQQSRGAAPPTLAVVRPEDTARS